MTAIDEVKQQTDIVQVIGQYIKLTKAGRLFRGLCPFHSEKTPSFYVYPERQTWHCFGACSTGGDVFSFLMKKEGLDFRETLISLAEKACVTLPSRPEEATRKEEKQQYYEVNAAAALFYHDTFLSSPAAEKARAFAAKRGINQKSINDFQIGYSPENRDDLKQFLVGKGYDENFLVSAGLLVQNEDGRTFDRFHGRIMFPIRDIRAQTIGLAGRALDDSLPKFLNSPETPVFVKGDSIYAIDMAAGNIRKQDAVIIVEGYIDVIIAHQHKINNVVATMGTWITDRQVSVLKRLTKNIVLALDPDAAGEEALLRCAAYENIVGAEMKVMSLPEGKDPDEVIAEDPATWDRLVKEATPLVDRVFISLTEGLDMTKPGDKQAAVDRLLPVIAEIGNPVRQTHYIQHLARMVKVRETALEAEMARLKSGPRLKVREESPARATPTSASRLEEHCLALLLQHPELKAKCEDLTPDHFQGTENRQIFVCFREGGDLSELDAVIGGHVERLKAELILEGGLEGRYTACALRLKERYLKDLEARRGEVLAMAAEAGGSGADLARLEEEGIQNSVKLREIHQILGKR